MSKETAIPQVTVKAKESEVAMPVAETIKPVTTGAAAVPKKPVATAAAVGKVVAKPSTVKKPAEKKAVAEKPVVEKAAKKEVAEKTALTPQAPAKPVKKASAAAKEKVASAPKAEKAIKAKKQVPKKQAPKKPKLVRDSFSIPESDYALFAALKQRALSAGIEVKKSEILRAALATLAQVGDAELANAIGRVERIKTGRPKK